MSLSPMSHVELRNAHVAQSILGVNSHLVSRDPVSGVTYTERYVGGVATCMDPYIHVSPTCGN